jgi:predicted HicB family RNase H-like nuclease
MRRRLRQKRTLHCCRPTVAIISFHGATVKALRSEFIRAIEDYLAKCVEKGIEPEKPASGKLLLRASPEVHGRALVAAQAAGKRLNQWAGEVLARAVRVRS